MRFEKTEQPVENVTNHVWLGFVQTSFGNIEIRVFIREDRIFDCTLMTFPETEGADLISFSEAEATLQAWKASMLNRAGTHDYDPTLRFPGVFFCAAGMPTMSSFAQSMDFPSEEALILGSELKIEGALRFTVILTSPKNFEDCAGSGAL